MEGMDFMQILSAIAQLGLNVTPLVIIVVLTEVFKRLVLQQAYQDAEGKTQYKDKIVAPWGGIMVFLTPAIFSIGVSLLFAFPNFNWLTYAQQVAGNWAFAALGFNGIKAILTKAGA